ncbi:MAG TPA: SpoIIE family protein phosphatase [Anaerolineales bacterium]|nr:SpoIIE family protein phosphatase [Anaerolineales bacterium]
MALDIFQRIQVGLDEKRHNVTEFLETASDAEKDVCLCEDDCRIDDHLQVINECLDRIEINSLGICEVCHGVVDRALLEMDYTAHVCLDHYSDQERRSLEDELQLSQVIQRALMPHRSPQISGVEIAAFSRPADIIGGDYFDFFRYRDGSHGLVIADVSGHGVSAGMLMSSLQTAIQTMAPDADSPAEILERINRFYIHNINFTTFVTVFLARYDPGDGTLTYVNSGHNPPAVFCRDAGTIHWLTRTAPAIGLAEYYKPRTEIVQLSPGDMLLLYTDGLTEAINHQMEQFGLQRRSEFVQGAADLSANEMLQTVRDGITAHRDGVRLSDDMTLVAMKVLG